MNKRILSVILSLVLALTMTTPALAATKPATKTVTFNTYATDDKHFTDFTATLKVTNVTKQTTKDFSMYMSDDDVTITGKKSKVITCKTKTTVTLQANKGDKHTRVLSFYSGFDSNKIKPASVKNNYKYYAFDSSIYDFNFSKTYTSANRPDSYGIAEGSSQTFTKAGTYVVYVRPLNGVDDTEVELTPVFIVVK